MNKIKALILRAPGTNCDLETASALKRAGAVPEIVHINRILRREVRLAGYRMLVIPGGFSYGDDIAAGKIFANKLMYRLAEEMAEFSRNQRPILGICNGFQVLVKSGLLPFGEGRQSVTLTNNDSGKYECRWVRIKINTEARSFWTEGLPGMIRLPVAHAEGKFYTDQETLDRVEKAGLVLFRYCDETGKDAAYPDNPNGALLGIAGITNPEGNIFGLMPHPERFALVQHSPWWSRGPKEEPCGFRILLNGVAYARRCS